MTIFILLVFVILTAIRLLRWLGIVQQKEYRLDRLKAFAFTDEGIKELFRLMPHKNDFSRTGLKRPVITPKIVVIAVITSLLIILYLKSIFAVETRLGWNIFHVIIVYIAIPLWIGMAIIPIQLVSAFIVWQELVKAQAKILKVTKYSNGRKTPIIIGITGSYGKTSTKHLLTFLLQDKYSVFTTPFSYNTKYSIARTINKSYVDQEIIILEYGAYTKNEIKELSKWFKPDTAIITGLAPQHLELFGSVENIVTAKAELIKALQPNASVYFFKRDAGAKQIVDEGKSNKEVQVKSVDLHDLDIELEHINQYSGKLSFSHNNKKIETPLIGLQYLAAIMLSLYVCRDLGISVNESLKRLAKFKPNKNFISGYTLKTGSYVIDDGGAANPRGVKAALKLLNDLELSEKTGKKYFVFPGIVDLGSLSNQIHLELALLSKKIGVTVWYVGEQGKRTFEEKVETCVIEKGQIISNLHTTTPNDIILIEGRMPGWFLTEIEKLKTDV